MKKHLILAVLVSLTSLSSAQALELSSPTMPDGSTVQNEQVFNGFGCSGTNVSPELKWSGAPEGTQSFAVTMYDPDAPTGSGWWHWVVFNLPPTTTGLTKGASAAKGKLPKGAVQSRTDFGKPGYGGPCPPPGDKPHRYIVTVYALKTDKLPLQADSPAAMVGFYIQQNKLAEASLTAKFGR